MYIGNLWLSSDFVDVEGSIIECGVWKGGMIAGMAELFGNRKKYFLFDSFKGLPLAKEIDGNSASNWQNDTEGNTYFGNCSADITFATKIMDETKVDYKIYEGWFSETLPEFNTADPIAILRLDGDWYESTYDCLRYLFPKVSYNGLIIIDDYAAWEGCSKAVHDYLSEIKSVSKIRMSTGGIYYIVKKDECFSS
ncbi:MAG: hypothetical protein EOP48_22340 [Sphingobacteriales bacterium]|nr:MAG: hypothetical protein EOP48_22340 [Sphingobacteriales bacterium]